MHLLSILQKASKINAHWKIWGQKYSAHTVTPTYIKFIYSEKATKFWEISTVDLSYVVTVKSTVEISQKFVAFSEYMNFIKVNHTLKFVKNKKVFFKKFY